MFIDRSCSVGVAVLGLLFGTPHGVRAQVDPVSDQPTTADGQPAPAVSPPTLEIYGFVEADAIVDIERNNPDWYDTNRPSDLPDFAHEFGQDGHFYLSPRQSRFGVKGTLPTSAGDVQATIEFDMLGTGADAGLTTFRLRHAWGQWKSVGAGQTYSQFMDPDIYPDRFEPWGPNGMVTSRNPQIFWQPYRQGDSNLTVAIENPGVAADGGLFADRIDLPDVAARFPMPDFTGHYRQATSWGYVQVAGVLLYVAYDDVLPHDPLHLSGHIWGEGVNLSSNVKVGPHDRFRLQAVYGHGIEDYLNDAPVDVGIKLNPGNPLTPFVGQSLPVFSMVTYLDHFWSEAWETSAGYSMVDVSNSSGELPSAFRMGLYATANLRYMPVRNLTIGGEFQWAQRRNFSDGWVSNDYRIDFSFKYNFSYKIGG